jgi:hypothetical protein
MARNAELSTDRDVGRPITYGADAGPSTALEPSVGWDAYQARREQSLT